MSKKTKSEKENKFEDIFETDLMYTGRPFSIWRDNGDVFMQIGSVTISFPEPEFIDLAWILCQLGTYLYGDLDKKEKEKIMKELVENREEVLCDECAKEKNHIRKTKGIGNKTNEFHSMYA